MPKTTDAQREKRLIVLDTLVQDLDFKGKQYSNADLLRTIQKKFPKTTRAMLEYDLTELSSNNQFVSNLGKYYSKYMQNRFDGLQEIKRMARKIHDTKWTASKKIVKEIPTANGTKIITETIATPEIATPKLGALKIMAEVEKQLTELASGKNLELSAAMWIKREKELRDEIKGLHTLGK